MSNNKSTYILGGIIFLALMALVSWPIGAAAIKHPLHLFS